MKKIFTKIINFFGKFKELETIEEKSFWIVSPAAVLMGLFGLLAAESYDSFWPALILFLTCCIVPVILMVFVHFRKNYHFAYPLLCLFLGIVAGPTIFFFNGGFLSGNILFLIVITSITSLCYLGKYRIITFIASLVSSGVSFFLAIKVGSPFPLTEVEIFLNAMKEVADADFSTKFNVFVNAICMDQIFAYYICSIGLFVILSWVTSNIRKYKINQDALEKYFDIAKRQEIFKNALASDGKLIGQHRNAVILFADISNFTSLTEKMNSDVVSNFLNDFFTMAGKHIHDTGGIIDKYIGDCVMAYWLEQENENCVLNCVEAMLRLKKELFEKAEEIYAKYGAEINFSAGIAYGDVIFGDIGSDTMHDYTIIGDAVNTASRIQDYATSGDVLISDVAALKIKDNIKLDKVETDHFFKGKNISIDIYRVLGSTEKNENESIRNIENFEYDLYVCGCRGSFPVSGLRFSEYGGETSCYLVKKGDYACIIDCGTGLKNAIPLIQDCKQIDVLLTHVHYDHILGLLMSKFPAGVKVKVYGQFDKWNRAKHGFVGFMEHPFWPIELSSATKKNVNVGDTLDLTEGLTAKFYESDHPDDACVITLNCSGKKICFLADCEDATKVNEEASENAELVFFDGMFDDEDKEKHAGWGHGTWQDGIRFVDGRNIKRLVITHHNPELGDHSLMVLENKARKQKQNVSFAKIGDVYHF